MVPIGLDRESVAGPRKITRRDISVTAEANPTDQKQETLDRIDVIHQIGSIKLGPRLNITERTSPSGSSWAGLKACATVNDSPEQVGLGRPDGLRYLYF